MFFLLLLLLVRLFLYWEEKFRNLIFFLFVDCLVLASNYDSSREPTESNGWFHGWKYTDSLITSSYVWFSVSFCLSLIHISALLITIIHKTQLQINTIFNVLTFHCRIPRFSVYLCIWLGTNVKIFHAVE